MLAAIVAMLFAFRAWLNTASGREKWDKIRLRMPIVGSIVNRAQLSRFLVPFL